MHFCVSRVARSRHLILLIALLLASLAFIGCGSQSGQPAQEPPPLPPPIPAAEPVLLYNGTGASSSDVSAIEAVLHTQGIDYATADSGKLNGMSEAQLAGYKLIIVPGGNSITIGQSLTTQTTSAIRGAVTQYGTHYLGICAGAFFGGIPFTTESISPEAWRSTSTPMNSRESMSSRSKSHDPMTIGWMCTGRTVPNSPGGARLSQNFPTARRRSRKGNPARDS